LRYHLETPRWGSGLRGERLPRHDNTEQQPTSRFRSVLFWVALAVATFVIIVAGYGSRLWT
jgi:hypothetical protein